MADPSFIYRLVGKAAYNFSRISPYIPTNLHMIVAALFPIYTGAHASLSRPPTAAKPSKKRLRRDGEPKENLKIEAMSPSDALLFPILAGLTLGGLYLLIKWLDDPELISKYLNWFLTFVGTFATTRLLSDSLRTGISFIFPRKYFDEGFIWELNQRRNCFEPTPTGPLTLANAPRSRKSPLPGLLSRIHLQPAIERALWKTRKVLLEPLLVIKFRIPAHDPGHVEVTLYTSISLVCAIAGTLYFNLVERPWWLTNIMGLGLSYNALQTMSPATFGTGSLFLSGLFFYDIYMVFFTPLMVTVATKLDIPAKLLFPRPKEEGESGTRLPLAMLGLGDIVIPGIMIALALRFDLWLFYLKMQRRKPDSNEDNVPVKLSSAVTGFSTMEEHPFAPLVYGKDGVGKARYKPATRNWGERFWLGRKYQAHEGSNFPKTYFYVSIIGYAIGLVVTGIVVHVFRRGQPALLYLVPAVLGSLWVTALVKGDTKVMWDYSELDEEEEMKQEKKQVEQNSEKQTSEGENGVSGNAGLRSDMKEPPSSSDQASSLTSGKKQELNKQSGFFSSFSFSASRPISPGKGKRSQTRRGPDSRGESKEHHAFNPSTDSDEFSDSDEGTSSPEFVERNTQLDEGPGAKRRRIA